MKTLHDLVELGNKDLHELSAAAVEQLVRAGCVRAVAEDRIVTLVDLAHSCGTVAGFGEACEITRGVKNLVRA